MTCRTLVHRSLEKGKHSVGTEARRLQYKVGSQDESGASISPERPGLEKLEETGKALPSPRGQLLTARIIGAPSSHQDLESVGDVHRHVGDIPWKFPASDEVESLSPHSFPTAACEVTSAGWLHEEEGGPLLHPPSLVSCQDIHTSVHHCCVAVLFCRLMESKHRWF